MTVEQPRGHDARVVRCSSCGAPREGQAASCGFCHSDFTLHERDLHTVCPSCLARVSDRARFCHHCATALTAEGVIGAGTDLVCPACEETAHLQSRQLGSSDFTMLECDHCAGIWLDLKVFSALTHHAAQSGQTADAVITAASPVPKASLAQRGPFYRRCPVCQQRMPRRNYSRRSGVIIDVCRNHGAWFDAHELPSLLAWIRAGGQAEAERQLAAEQRAEEIASRHRKRERYTADDSGAGPVAEGSLAEIALAAAEFLSHFFWR